MIVTNQFQWMAIAKAGRVQIGAIKDRGKDTALPCKTQQLIDQKQHKSIELKRSMRSTLTRNVLFVRIVIDIEHEDI